jgi:hypothetical protein
MGAKPETVEELYPRKWVKAADLQGPTTVVIREVAVEDLRLPDGSTKTAAVLALATPAGKPCARRLILNKTMCRSLVNLTRSERFADWPGATISLAPATAPNGRPTIAVGPANGREVS